MRHIVITGASGAIGSALALEYAEPDVVLWLQGRRQAALGDVAQRSRARGAQVQIAAFDLRDFTAVRNWAGQVVAQGAPDLLIANAGLNTHVGPHGEPEPWEDVEALLDVNLKAAMLLVHEILPAMRAARRGQIALVSSLAAYFGLPVTPTYCATKAGLKAYGEALRGWLAPEGIRVNVIMPGYVKSPMCDDMPGPKPFLWTPERAAKVIRRGLERDKARISFPFPLNWGTWWLMVLPAAVSVRLVRGLGWRRGL